MSCGQSPSDMRMRSASSTPRSLLLALRRAAGILALLMIGAALSFGPVGCDHSPSRPLTTNDLTDGSDDGVGGGSPPDTSGPHVDPGDAPPADSTSSEPPSPPADPVWSEDDPLDRILSVAPTLWYGGRAAACSFAFDDTRMSHYYRAAPELEQRGFRGTFNLITSHVTDWQPWQELVDHGHEIANHTRDHIYFDQLSPEGMEDQIRLGKRDIMEHLTGIGDVPSFTYPGGICPPGAASIVARYHVSARVGQGVASADPADLTQLPGCGYYVPYLLWKMNQNLDSAIATGGWYIGYFHNIVEGGVAYLDCPLSVFRAHLDYAKSRSEAVWVAPQGEVADYILRRRSFRYRLTPGPDAELIVEADGSGSARALTVELTLRPVDAAVRLTLNGESRILPPGQTRVLVDVVPGRSCPIKIESAVTPTLAGSPSPAREQRLSACADEGQNPDWALNSGHGALRGLRAGLHRLWPLEIASTGRSQITALSTQRYNATWPLSVPHEEIRAGEASRTNSWHSEQGGSST